MEEMARRLREARGDKTRKEVCDICGISVSALMMYENGKRTPRDKIKTALARCYNKSVQDLFYFN